MLKNDVAIRIAVDDYKRLEKLVAHQAYEECDHKSKCQEDCFRKKECYQQGIIDFLFKLKTRWN